MVIMHKHQSITKYFWTWYKIKNLKIRNQNKTNKNWKKFMYNLEFVMLKEDLSNKQFPNIKNHCKCSLIIIFWWLICVDCWSKTIKKMKLVSIIKTILRKMIGKKWMIRQVISTHFWIFQYAKEKLQVNKLQSRKQSKQLRSFSLQWKA